MSPARRKIVYAVSFELIGIAVGSLALWFMSGAKAQDSLALSALGATLALVWSYVFNTAFEAWESRQAVRGRPFRRRVAHALLFEAGLVIMLVPVMAWWLDVTLIEAVAYEAGLIVVFIVYTWVFTWAFDHIFGLPASAR